MLEVAKVAGRIGAEVHGIDLARPLADGEVAAVRKALIANKVLFFRDQVIGHDEHIAFARRFGTVLRRVRPQSSTELDAYPEIWTISPEVDREQYGFDHEEQFRLRMVSGNAGWHTDLSNTLAPPAASVLRTEECPAFGGDTAWANLAAAYEGLSPLMRKLVEGLHAEHTFFAGLDMDETDPVDAGLVDMISSRAPVSIHPVVTVHPESRERVLFVNPARTSRIVEMTPNESRHLLAFLFDHLARPEYTVRFRWAPGSVAFWDNRATAHVAVGDYSHTGQRRRMHRVTLMGAPLSGADGSVSTSVWGEALAGA